MLSHSRFRVMGAVFFGAVLMGLFSGCDDPIRPSTGPGGAARSQQAGDVAQEPAVIPRFDLSFDVSGAFKPGVPVAMTLHVRAALLSEATIQMVAPEAESARRSGWTGDRFRVPVRERLEPFVVEDAVMPEGSRRSVAEAIVFEAPGYYQVSAVVRDTTSPVFTESGQVVEGVAHASLWVLITENGGGITPHFFPDSIPEGYAKEPGPFRTYEDQQAADSLGFDVLGDAVSQCSEQGQCMNHVKVIYYDADSTYYAPLPGAAVTVAYYDIEYDYGYPYVAGGGGFDGWADANGRFHFDDPCVQSGWVDLVEITVYARTRQARIYNAEVPVGPTTASYQRYGGYCIPGYGVNVTLPKPGARAVRSVTAASLGAADFFGAAAPQAQIDLKDGSTFFGLFPTDIPLPFYDMYRNHIEINNDQIFGGGIGSLAHEFGHFYHHKVIGGLDEVYPYSESLGSVSWQWACFEHNLNTHETPSCAFMEGFAQLVAVASIGQDAGDYRYRNIVELGMRDGMGYRSEGPIASYLWRVATGSGDGVAIGGPNLRSALEFCEDREPDVLDDSPWDDSWGPINSVASLTYCLEREQNGWWLPIGGDVNYASVSASADHNALKLLATEFLLDGTDPPALAVDITGPSDIDAGVAYEWTAAGSGGSGSYSYQWSIFWDGLFHWVDLGTAATQQVQSTTGEGFRLQVVLSDGGATAADTVTVVGDGGGDGPVTPY